MSRISIGILFIGFWVSNLISATVAILIAIPLIVIILRVFSKRFQKFYHRLEQRFLINLNAREIAAKENSPAGKLLKDNLNPASELSPWDAHIIDLQVNPNASYAGKTLEELAWRETFGINIAYIKRGEQLIYAPNRYKKLLPFDHVGIIASDEQIQTFKPIFDSTECLDESSNDVEDIIVQKFVVNEQNKLKGLTVRDSGIREKTDGLIIGIERENKRILNPDSFTVFEWGDVVWIVGDRKKIQGINQFL
jgi:CPA2 family monovalent cation:H+ antiporter-2